MTSELFHTIYTQPIVLFPNNYAATVKVNVVFSVGCFRERKACIKFFRSSKKNLN